ncbi:MAG: type II toxin-antitoxin system Phd/YefM family antitoxin [Acidobacteriia bacterium]|nr:type II toxin-antitoxin system Phd/YefM family antitoxin [Terriglobia bacterium]
MTKVISTTKASAQLDQLIRKANRQKTRFMVGKPGEAAGVLVGIEDYIRTFAPEPKVLKMIGEQSKKKGTDKLTMRQIDREIAAYRKEKRTANAKSRA